MERVVGRNQRLFSVAHVRLTTAPSQLTDADLAQLEIFDPALAQRATELREKALRPVPSPVPRQARAAGADDTDVGLAPPERDGS
jgi:hypothetical protein